MKYMGRHVLEKTDSYLIISQLIVSPVLTISS
jgi:hypothetical protein